ncbi:MAG: hypothetical protein ABI823_11270 [Bryobacteraceae bacterium]
MIRALSFLLSLAALAQSPARLEYKCTDDDIHELGLSCTTEEPCPVFLELTSVAQAGARLIVVGNFHTSSQTLHTVLLASEDGGRTFTEPHPRLRAAVLEQIQFVDLETGWISGHNLLPLPRDPFVLLTTDGGKTFRQRPLSDESRNGATEQFWFDSKRHGRFVVNRGAKYELWESETGGESWSLGEVKSTAIPLPREQTPSLRLRADKTTFRIERRGGDAWELVASFLLRTGDCRPPEPEEPKEKPPEPEPAKIKPPGPPRR